MLPILRRAGSKRLAIYSGRYQAGSVIVIEAFGSRFTSWCRPISFSGLGARRSTGRSPAPIVRRSSAVRSRADQLPGRRTGLSTVEARRRDFRSRRRSPSAVSPPSRSLPARSSAASSSVYVPLERTVLLLLALAWERRWPMCRAIRPTGAGCRVYHIRKAVTA
jgi:hypothetical protein